jgi:hypothetical protein
MQPPLKTSNKRLTKRLSQRDAMWQDAEKLVFPTGAGGWSQMPRTVPMIASLIDHLSGKDKPGRLYIALWAHEFGDGLVEIPDPAQVALEAGYITNRAERTFGERIEQLKAMGFVKTSAVGMRDYGFVLLVDPHRVVADLYEKAPERIPERWWTAFNARCAAVGVRLRTQPQQNGLGAWEPPA